MTKEKELLKNTGIIFVGKLGVKFMMFILLPVYTWVLAPSDLGEYDLINSYISFLIIIFSMQLENSIFRELSLERKNLQKVKEIFTTTVLLTIFQSIIYVVFFIIFRNSFNLKYNIYLVFNVMLSIVLNILIGFIRGVGYNKQYSILGLVVATTSLLLNILFVLYFRMKIDGLFLATFISQLVGILYLVIKLELFNYFSYENFNIDLVKKLYKYGLPLVPNELAWSVIRLSDKIVVSKFLPIAVLGYMSIANKFSQVLLDLFSIFGLSWTESILIHYKDDLDEKYFKKIVKIAMNIFFSLSIVLLLLLKFFYSYLIKGDYSFGYNLIPLYIAGILFNIYVGLISTIFVAKGESVKIALTSVITAFINIGVNLLLIRKVGVYAAPISTAIAFFLLAFLRYCYLDNKYRKIFSIWSLGLYFSIFLIIMYVYYENKNSISFLLIPIVFIILGYLNKSEIKLIYNFFISLLRRD